MSPPPVRKRGKKTNAFRFIDLFAGIGGMHLALEKLGGHCVLASEKDQKACETYEANFGMRPHGDIRALEAAEIPEHNILAAGFPCQAFSIAGVSKLTSMGRKHGFKDATRGTLFFEICRIAEERQPEVLLLENVKNLQWHDEGRTLKVIKKRLDEIGYEVTTGVVSSAYFVPQRRERIFIVGIRKDLGTVFRFPPAPSGPRPVLADILDPGIDQKYTLNDHLWNYLQERKIAQKAKGNGFGYGLFEPDQSSRTLPARYGKDGADILIAHPPKNPRRLSPRECSRLMGFESFRPKKKFILNKSEPQCYKQFGNAVVPHVVEFLGLEILKQLGWPVRIEAL